MKAKWAPEDKNKKEILSFYTFFSKISLFFSTSISAGKDFLSLFETFRCIDFYKKYEIFQIMMQTFLLRRYIYIFFLCEKCIGNE